MNEFEQKGLAISDEDFEKAEATAAKLKPRSDQRVCACGHPMGRHKTVQGRAVGCVPSAMTCPCLSPKPVFTVSDLRPFLRKTTGPGSEHALARGLKQLIDKRDGEWDWVDEEFKKCERCEALGVEPADGGVWPVAINAAGRVSREPERTNALICKRCVEELS